LGEEKDAMTPTATTVVKLSERATALRAAMCEDLSDPVSLISEFSYTVRIFMR
jgi:hypothetical protein